MGEAPTVAARRPHAASAEIPPRKNFRREANTGSKRGQAARESHAQEART
nr:MAG TPA_asm: hypothetical protein [Caudoviricetes sp.]